MKIKNPHNWCITDSITIGYQFKNQPLCITGGYYSSNNWVTLIIRMIGLTVILITDGFIFSKLLQITYQVLKKVITGQHWYIPLCATHKEIHPSEKIQTIISSTIWGVSRYNCFWCVISEGTQCPCGICHVMSKGVLLGGRLITNTLFSDFSHHSIHEFSSRKLLSTYKVGWLVSGNWQLSVTQLHTEGLLPVFISICYSKKFGNFFLFLGFFL